MILYEKNVVKEQFENRKKNRIFIYCCIIVFFVVTIGYSYSDYKNDNQFKVHPVLIIGLLHCVMLLMQVNGIWLYKNKITVQDTGVVFYQNSFYKPTNLLWENMQKISVTNTSVKFYSIDSKDRLYNFNGFVMEDVKTLRLWLQNICQQKNIEFVSK